MRVFQSSVWTSVLALLAMGLAKPCQAGNIASISNLAVTAGSPAPGAAITVQWDYTTQDNFNDPRYIVVIGPTCALQPANTANQFIVIGDSCTSGSQVNGTGCDTIPDNQTGPAITHTKNQALTVPSSLTPGSTYYIIVAMKSYNIYMNPSVSVEVQTCLAFTVPLPPPYINLSKAAEGSSALAGGLVLYTLYYEFGNVTNVALSDVVDTANLDIVQIYNGGAQGPPGTITWNFPGFTSTPVTGFVSFLAQVKAGTPLGTIIHNQSTATSSGGASGASNDATVAVGQVNFTLTKSVNPTSSVSAGDTLTYTLLYTSQGQSLVVYENFDSGLPAGWSATGAGNWVAGSGYLEQTVGVGVGYPKYMYTSMTPIHDAVYVTDMRISSAATNTYDAVFNFNSNPAQTQFYQTRISSDTNNIALDHEGVGIASTSNPHGLTILNDVWYTVKTEVICNNIRAKVWPRGTTEPGTWDINTSSALYPGPGFVGYQANDGPAAYDNLKVFSLQAGTNVRVWDTVPTGTTYIAGSCSGCSVVGSTLTWTVGGACGNTGSVSFRATVDNPACVPISNFGRMDSDDPPPALASNTVISSVTTGGACNSPTPTSTFTFTPTRTSTPTNTATPTFSSTATPTSSFTATPSRTATLSSTPTSTETATRTSTSTPTASSTATPSRTPTATVTDTNTLGPSPTDTPSLTQTTTRTSTSTSSSTPTSTETSTETMTRTSTSTVTLTPTSTSTQPPFSPTNTPTITATPSITETSTATATATQTSTYSSTPSLTATPTQSFTYTGSPTSSATPTPSGTPTQSFTFTGSPSSSATPSLTNTPTASVTSTATPSRTPTPTATLTFSVSPTWSPSPTITVSPVPVPHRVLIAAYNSAGELVRILFDGSAQTLPGDLQLSGDSLGAGTGEAVTISFPGTLSKNGAQLGSTLDWKGDNDSGQAVAGGVYYIKAEIHDQYDTVTTLVKPVQVVSVAPSNELAIFNSAGELVYSRLIDPRALGAPVGDRFVSLRLATDNFAPEFDTATGAVLQPLVIYLRDEKGSEYAFAWDGRSDRGLAVAGGNYNIQLTYRAPTGAKNIESRDVTVLKTSPAASLSSALLGPNPALRGADLLILYSPSAAWSCVARVFNLAGELVAQGEDPLRTGRLTIQTRGLATGLYFVELEKINGAQGVQERAVFKAAVLR